MRKRDKKSYPQFEGRIIKWTNPRLKGGKMFYGKIVGCDYDIGVTIVDADDENHKLACFHGPSSVIGRANMEKDEMYGRDTFIKRYDVCFQYILDTLRSNGVYRADEREERVLSAGIQVTKGGGALVCAFGV